MAAILGCGGESRPVATPPGDATPATQAVLTQAVRGLALADQQDFEDANRGLVGRDAALEIKGPNGKIIWSAADDAFIQGDAPPTVHPSLWRQAKLNAIHGLFEVAEGIYQVRGYDVSNLTLIKGKTGWIVVDPLSCTETAAAAMALARKHLGDLRIVAVVLTHSHVDHFGGIDAVLPEGEARAGVRIVAPEGFYEEATSENLLAGPTMTRRAGYMYGMLLESSARAHVTTGLGKAPSRGTVTLVQPTDIVDRTPQPLELDGVRFVFQFTPDSEAPAEFTFYLPDAKAYCGAEIVSHTMHNLYTLRGAKVRDALRWSGYIDEAVRLFGAADIVFASHNWPTWGNARVIDYLKKQRDTYRFLHDQTLRLATQGATPHEISEAVQLPSTLAATFANRGYYGTVRHNVKAVYQWYFGWFDGNPAHLDPLPPETAGKQYVEAMGGVDAVVDKAQAAFDRGEYRWAATLLDHAVFAEPAHAGVRALLARTYEQLGYQAESGPWRDFYLTGAKEVQQGPSPSLIDLAANGKLLARLPGEELFDIMAVRLDAPAADGVTESINVVFTDVGESYVLTVENAVLHHRLGAPDASAVATVRLTKPFFVRLMTNQVGLQEAITSSDLAIEGSRLGLLNFLRRFDKPKFDFAIVTP